MIYSHMARLTGCNELRPARSTRVCSDTSQAVTDGYQLLFKSSNSTEPYTSGYVCLSITPHCRLDTCVARKHTHMHYTCTVNSLATSGRAPNRVDAVAHDNRGFNHDTICFRHLFGFTYGRVRATFVQQYIYHTVSEHR